jgi:hypothetical protein
MDQKWRGWCEVLGGHPTCPLVHDWTGLPTPWQDNTAARDAGLDYQAWVDALVEHEEACSVAHDQRIAERRKRRALEWAQLSPRQQGQRRRRARERFDAMLAQGEEAERREAEAEGWSLPAWRLFMNMDDLDLRLFVAVHGVTYKDHDELRRMPLFVVGDDLRRLCELAAATDPELPELIRERSTAAMERRARAMRHSQGMPS